MGQAHKILAEIADRIGHRIWILVDEWSAIPEVLQPYLADFIKRTFFPIRNYSVHIAAIEQRSNFRQGDGATAVGIELSSDASADIDLDDHLVFEINPDRSLAFFREMLFRHVTALDAEARDYWKSGDEFIQAAFTQEPNFRELVRASEGVPRDAINILQMAATRAQGEKISIADIRSSARDWYERDKTAYVGTNAQAQELLHWLIDQVIGARRARAFLVRSDVRDEILERLFDERILHIAKRSYSAKEQPGVRYKVWKLDYGCYVNLINTSGAPHGFLIEGIEAEGDWTYAVPEDDFRAIRRAVLDLKEFYAARGSAALEALAPIGMESRD